MATDSQGQGHIWGIIVVIFKTADSEGSTTGQGS